jgi:hypothetical protein
MRLSAAVRSASTVATACWWRCQASRSRASALARASRVISSASGFPAAAAVYAKAITQNRLAEVKTPITPENQDGGAQQATTEVIGTDEGVIDLGDLQYVLFSMVGIGYFVVTFLTHPDRGLPTMPGVLVGLAGVSAAVYATKKSVETGVKPNIVTVTPKTVIIGRTTKLTIHGRSLI